METKTKTIIIERTLHLPVSTVWKAWSDPETFKKWWGPENYSCPQVTIDFKVGGKCLACMQAPDGKQNWSIGTYKEILQDKRIVVTDSFSDSDGNILSGSQVGLPGEWPDVLLITLEFQEHEGDTLLLLTHEGMPEETAADCIQGWQQSFDKLEANLK